MFIQKLKRGFKHFLCGISLTLLIAAFISPSSFAQLSGLGYSEAPFLLLDNAAETRGSTPIEAIRAASASEEEITEELTLEKDGYAFTIVTFNSIGISVATKKVDQDWQFVCRAGGVMAPPELNDRCGIPLNTAEYLYQTFLSGPRV